MFAVDMLPGDGLFYPVKIMLFRLIHVLIDKVYRTPIDFAEQMDIRLFQRLCKRLFLVNQKEGCTDNDR
jgi:hypothetical protein